MADKVAGSFAPVEINNMQPDHFDLKSSSIRQDKQLDQRKDKDDPDHDLVAEQLYKFFSYDECNCPHSYSSLILKFLTLNPMKTAVISIMIRVSFQI